MCPVANLAQLSPSLGRAEGSKKPAKGGRPAPQAAAERGPLAQQTEAGDMGRDEGEGLVPWVKAPGCLHPVLTLESPSTYRYTKD